MPRGEPDVLEYEDVLYCISIRDVCAASVEFCFRRRKKPVPAKRKGPHVKDSTLEVAAIFSELRLKLHRRPTGEELALKYYGSKYMGADSVERKKMRDLVSKAVKRQSNTIPSGDEIKN